MRSSTAAVLLLGALVGCNDAGAPAGLLAPDGARAAVVTNEQVTFSEVLDGPEIIECVGEPVRLTGSEHLLVIATTDANGGVHGTIHVNTQGVSGVGVETGTRFHAAQATTLTFQIPGPPPAAATLTNTLVLTSEGGGRELLVHQLLHVTVAATGEVTAVVEQGTAVCGEPRAV